VDGDLPDAGNEHDEVWPIPTAVGRDPGGDDGGHSRNRAKGGNDDDEGLATTGQLSTSIMPFAAQRDLPMMTSPGRRCCSRPHVDRRRQQTRLTILS
jgi:hypothetical protein